MKNVKKGFTLVELLFVMAIIAILAGFAIANLKDSTKVATEKSMQNDAKNAITIQQTYFAANQDYDTILGTEVITNGMLETAAGTKFTVSKGNVIVSTAQVCTDGGQGFTVNVSNAKLAEELSFDSCTDGVISDITAI